MLYAYITIVLPTLYLLDAAKVQIATETSKKI